jgi:2OG-Fe(II) oxygenase superfamily
MPKAMSQSGQSFALSSFPSVLLSSDETALSKLAYKPPLALHDGFIWTLGDFLTKKECQNWINFAEEEGRLQRMQQRGTRFMALRHCYRFNLEDSAMAARLFHRLQQTRTYTDVLESHFSGQVPVACSPNLRIYKYENGMSFGKHVDGSESIPGVGATRMTMLIYLSDCQGGATRFYETFQPRVGSLLLHVHGDECLEHEADPVTNGTKYVLRTDLVYGPAVLI